MNMLAPMRVEVRIDPVEMREIFHLLSTTPPRARNKLLRRLIAKGYAIEQGMVPAMGSASIAPLPSEPPPKAAAVAPTGPMTFPIEGFSRTQSR